MNKFLLLTYLLMTSQNSFTADIPRIQIDPSRVEGKVSPLIYGQFLEHIYESVVGGLDGQLILGGSFEEDADQLGVGWDVQGGSWGFEKEELVSRTQVTDGHVLTGDRSWRDLDFTVEARKEKGFEGFLILFRVQDENNFYWWNLGGYTNKGSCVELEQNGNRVLVNETYRDIRIEEDRWYTLV